MDANVSYIYLDELVKNPSENLLNAWTFILENVHIYKTANHYKYISSGSAELGFVNQLDVESDRTVKLSDSSSVSNLGDISKKVMKKF